MMNFTNKNIRLLLTLILIFGAILRIQAVIYTQVDNPIRADAAKYVLCAYNLKFFNTYSHSDAAINGNPTNLKPDALVTPGFSLFLMPFLKQDINQSNYMGILFCQVAMSVLTILFSYLLFSNITNKEIGLGIAMLTALSPHLINMNVYLLTETLFCFILVAALACLSIKKSLENRWILLATGLLLGYASLTRPWIQGYSFILFLYLVFSNAKVPIHKAAFLLIGFALVISPWLIRNQLSLGYASDPTLSITSIYHGSFPGMMYDNKPETLGFAYHFDPKINTASDSAEHLKTYLNEKFNEHPWIYFKWYAFGKIAAVFSWSITGGIGDVFVYPVFKTPFVKLLHFRVIHDLMEIMHTPLMTFSLLGCLLVWMPPRKLPFSSEGIIYIRSISLLFLYFVILHIIGAPYSRYSIPLRPIQYGMAISVIVILTHIVNLFFKNHLKK